MPSLGTLTRSSKPATTPTGGSAPSASRATTPTWRDPRLWLGLVLVAVSVVGGARLLAAADDSVSVWAVGSEAKAGTALSPEGLVSTRVRFVEEADLARYYLTSAELPAEAVLVRDIGAGELLPRAALGDVAEGTRQVPVQVGTGSVPPAVGAGSRIDLYVSDEQAGKRPATLLLEDVVVVDAPADADQFGTGSERQLVLAVPDADSEDLARVIAAANAGTVTVVSRG